MINHARTVLLNRAAVYFNAVGGSEYIPKDFQPVTLGANLRTAHRIIMPQGLDKFGENYVASAVMRLLHSPDLSPYIDKLDRRNTYMASPELLARTTDDPIVREDYQSNSCDLTANYSISPGGYPSTIGLSGKHTWTITPTDKDRVMVKYSRGKEEILAITNGTTSTDPIQLIPGYLTLKFTAPTKRLTGKFRHICTKYLAVPYNLGTIQAELEQYMARPGFDNHVFGDVPGFTQELETLKTVWRRNPEITLRTGAAILGVIYQLEGLRLRREQ